ncbi:hypothetical protein [Anabaena sp. PCC 7108]|uniref:Cas10/Cmr2 second palm domain-containing protein n=1 Tax=Anabaena sp. PCC 7108 TaxID=163908 RepID=UPI0003489FBC|nr:hypothetical protein [Anabaena sp. PCC 7108]
MSKFTITVIDTSGIQGYIFSSNRLRENIGASHLVSEVTDDWVKETLDELGVPENQQNKPIETSEFNAEIVYAGGGNTLILFKSREIAISFTRILSKRVLEKAPGINLVVAHADFDWDEDNLYQVVKDLMEGEIDHRKHERIPSAPLLGLGVTAVCNSTQLPAVDRSNKYIQYGDEEEADSYLISTETKQKLKAVDRANKKLQDMFADVVDGDIYQFPYRTDHLGRSQRESSYVAIVHADGNGMGKRFQKYGEDAKNNRDYIERMGDFSKSVHKAGKNALKAVVEVITKSIKEGKVVGKLGEFQLKEKYLPFRPLVYGGDDITFICEGRIGLELATLFLQKFEEQDVADGEKLTACAGVCVVKTHYPFARAYKISDELCKEAKKFVKENKESEPDGFSAIDWHLAASGLLGSISEIRKLEYQVTVDNKDIWNLAMRPVRLKKHSSEWRTWEGFTQIIKEFKEGKDWKERHNKVMALREVLREASDDATKEFLSAYKLSQLPSFPESSGQSEHLVRKGWLNNRCGYFDAIEAMEFYLELED